MRHLDKNQPVMETRDDRVTKEIINTYKKFGIDNANPTRAIMRRTGADVGQATQLVVTNLHRSADIVTRIKAANLPGNWNISSTTINGMIR